MTSLLTWTSHCTHLPPLLSPDMKQAHPHSARFGHSLCVTRNTRHPTGKYVEIREANQHNGASQDAHEETFDDAQSSDIWVNTLPDLLTAPANRGSRSREDSSAIRLLDKGEDLDAHSDPPEFSHEELEVERGNGVDHLHRFSFDSKLNSILIEFPSTDFSNCLANNSIKIQFNSSKLNSILI